VWFIYEMNGRNFVNRSTSRIWSEGIVSCFVPNKRNRRLLLEEKKRDIENDKNVWTWCCCHFNNLFNWIFVNVEICCF
jgi:hypothetical protein